MKMCILLISFLLLPLGETPFRARDQAKRSSVEVCSETGVSDLVTMRRLRTPGEKLRFDAAFLLPAVGKAVRLAVPSQTALGNEVKPEREPEPLTAILGALTEEVSLLQAVIEDRTETRILGISFTAGRLKGRRVVVVASGIGKVNAAVTTALLLDHYRPGEVLFSGVAGGLNRELQAGDIVIAEKTAQHDLGDITGNGMERVGVTNPLTGKRNPTFFPADPRLLKAAEKAAGQVQLASVKLHGVEHKPRIVKGVVVTGDVFVASAAKAQELRKALGADAVEMEGGAVAQICHQQGVPCLVLRCLSDLADGNAPNDFQTFAPQAARNAAVMVTEIVQQLRTQQQ